MVHTLEKRDPGRHIVHWRVCSAFVGTRSTGEGSISALQRMV